MTETKLPEEEQVEGCMGCLIERGPGVDVLCEYFTHEQDHEPTPHVWAPLVRPTPLGAAIVIMKDWITDATEEEVLMLHHRLFGDVDI